MCIVVKVLMYSQTSLLVVDWILGKLERNSGSHDMIWLFVALCFPLSFHFYSWTICVSCGLKAALAMSGCFVGEVHFVASQELRVWESTIRLWSLAPSVQSGGGRWHLGAPDRKHWAAPARTTRKGTKRNSQAEHTLITGFVTGNPVFGLDYIVAPLLPEHLHLVSQKLDPWSQGPPGCQWWLTQLRLVYSVYRVRFDSERIRARNLQPTSLNKPCDLWPRP